MDRVYLQEAFHAMELLEEEDFRLDDVGVKDIIDFYDNDELNQDLDVIDDEATDETEVKDSYIGSVILECDVCHSPIFKDVEDIDIDEESGLANIEDECPICHSQDGFKIIGQVCPFQEDPEIKVEVEDKPEDEDAEVEVDDEVEDEDKEVEESLDEEKCPICGKDVDEPCEDCKEKADELKEELDPELEEKLDELKDEIDEVEDKIDAVANEVCPECEIDEIEEPVEDDAEVEAEEILNDEEAEDKEEEKEEEVDESLENKEPVREGFEKVDLEMEDKIIHVSEEEKEPIPDAEMITPISDELAAELLAPEEEVGAEEIAAEEPVEDVPEVPVEAEEDVVADEEPDFEEEAEEESDFEESLEAEEKEAINEDCCKEEDEEEMVDFDVEDFSEDEFNKLGEAYLKNVYENVNSFSTSSVAQDNDKLVVEGVITFNSGKEKATKFIFEAKDATKSGKVRFVGENAQISRGKKSFTLAGTITEGKFIAESLNYNYRVDSNRVYGTVKVNE